MTAGPERIALFGGSFDPPHCAHLAIARAAAEHCGLQQVIFIPCRISPLKGRSPGASGADRLAMLRLATNGMAWASVSDWELSRPGPSYSWQSAEHFAESTPVAASSSNGVGPWWVSSSFHSPKGSILARSRSIASAHRSSRWGRARRK